MDLVKLTFWIFFFFNVFFSFKPNKNHPGLPGIILDHLGWYCPGWYEIVRLSYKNAQIQKRFISKWLRIKSHIPISTYKLALLYINAHIIYVVVIMTDIAKLDEYLILKFKLQYSKLFNCLTVALWLKWDNLEIEK